MLNINDLQFFLDKTGLDPKRFINLIEEDRDFDLVIESIACHLSDVDKKILPKLSQKLRTKIILYNLSCHKNYDISEKSYISDILYNNYNQIYKTCYLSKKSIKKEIKHFISVINNMTENKKEINVAVNNFIKLGRKDISSHLCDWINIIQESKKIIKSYISVCK